MVDADIADGAVHGVGRRNGSRILGEGRNGGGRGDEGGETCGERFNGVALLGMGGL
jgi:hypothetical protein